MAVAVAVVGNYSQVVSPKSKPMLTSLSMSKIPSSSLTLPTRKPFSLFCCSCSLSPISSSPPKPNLFIKGLPLSTTEGRLVKAFSEFGEVSEVKLLMDKESGQFLGFAYIFFAKEESAQFAVEKMNGKFFDGRFIGVRIPKSGSSKNQRNTAPYKF